ncbi:MAG TPA: hypothetical protein VGE47_16730 [Burkholderiaceae bacterium]
MTLLTMSSDVLQAAYDTDEAGQHSPHGERSLANRLGLVALFASLAALVLL